MGAKIKARYESLTLPSPGRLRFPPVKSVRKQEDARYCLEIVRDAVEDLRNNGPELVKEEFTSRQQALDAILEAIPHPGTFDLRVRIGHIWTCLTFGWAIGMREEVSGLAKPGASEEHHVYALILATGKDEEDPEDWAAANFAFGAGYYLARCGDPGMEYVRSQLKTKRP